MGSYGGISFDDVSICSNKSCIPDEWAFLFQETDRQFELRLHEDARPDEAKDLIVWYETERKIFLSRLSILGATESALKNAFDSWHAEKSEGWERCANNWDQEIGEPAKEIRAGLAAMDFERWKAYANQVLRTRYNFEAPYQPSNAIEKEFHDHDGSFLHIAGYGDLISIRALLEACPEVKSIKLDISDLINSGYYDETDEICAEARKNLLLSQPLGPTVILGEGSTDLLVLKRSLKAMHPALVDYFSFFDHAEFKVDGGAAYLVKFLKAFAAANVIGRFVAIFDNDAAGVQALGRVADMNLPANFLPIKLPNIKLASCYPTLGPSGPAELDVNGSAAGIELYLGREALTASGVLRPVRWTGYVQDVKRYQGEVEGKADVLAAFLERIDICKGSEEAQAAFPELQTIWQTIFDVVEKHAGESPLRHE